MEFGNRLRRLRHERRMSLEDLAAAADTSKSTICNLEGRLDSNPTSLLRRVAEALVVPAERLCEDRVRSVSETAMIHLVSPDALVAAAGRLLELDGIDEELAVRAVVEVCRQFDEQRKGEDHD